LTANSWHKALLLPSFWVKNLVGFIGALFIWNFYGFSSFQGLAGKDDWEEAKASEICDAINDCALEMTAYFMALGGVVPGDLVTYY
jgi:hypothetical protein